MLSPSYTRSIRDYMVPTNLIQPWKEGSKIPFTKAKAASPMHAIAVTVESEMEGQVYLFYLEEDGTLVTTNWTESDGWKSFITVVAVLTG